MDLVRSVPDLAVLRARSRRLLAVFPHPDDESYGPAGTLAREGHREDAAAVLLCLTRGTASSMGKERGIGPEEVGAIRTRRLEEVARHLELDGLIVADLPDGGVARLHVDETSGVIAEVLDALRPQVVLGHDPRGVNAHPDHVATHWALRFALRERVAIRFAMVAYPPSVAEDVAPRLLFATPEEQIDAVVRLTDEEIEAKEAALRTHEAFVTLRTDPEPGKIRRPPVERFDFLTDPVEGTVDDVFAGLVTATAG